MEQNLIFTIFIFLVCSIIVTTKIIYDLRKTKGVKWKEKKID